MTFWERLGSLFSVRESRASLENPHVPLNGSNLTLYQVLAGAPSEAGVYVTERSAMQLSAVWTCVNILSGAIASLPLKVYETQKRGRSVAKQHRLYSLLHDSPSSEDTSFTFRHKLMANLLLCGNGYAELVRDGANRVAAIYPWPASSVKIEYGSTRGAFRYLVTDSGFERTGRQRQVDPFNMLHLRGFCFEGVEGLSVIQNHRRGLGLAVATEVFASNFYSNGAKAGGILMTPGRVNEKQRENLTKSFAEKYQGVENAHKTILLEEGVKYQQLTIPQNDAQFLETRQFSRAEIAGIYGVPTMLVPGADDTPPTYASSESFMRYFVDFSLRNWLTLWQSELNAKLFAGTPYYAEFETRDLLRADATGRAQLHKAMWEIGAKSANEIREDENDNPVDGGDRYFVPMNYVPTDKVDEVLEKGSDPAQPAVEPDSGEDERHLSTGLQRLLAGELQRIREWGSDYSEARAAKRLVVFLRAVADDLIGYGEEDEFVNEYAGQLAVRARTLEPEAIPAELRKIAADFGGKYVQN